MVSEVERGLMISAWRISLASYDGFRTRFVSMSRCMSYTMGVVLFFERFRKIRLFVSFINACTLFV